MTSREDILAQIPRPILPHDSAWHVAELPGTGWSCLRLVRKGHVAWIWQSSQWTTGGGWCWSTDFGGGVRTIRGNMGSAKVAAAAALRRGLETRAGRRPKEG